MTQTTQVGPRLRQGDPAPDLALIDGQRASVQLASLWAEQPLVLVFLRHFG